MAATQEKRPMINGTANGTVHAPKGAEESRAHRAP